jgi:hypothetical protein
LQVIVGRIVMVEVLVNQSVHVMMVTKMMQVYVILIVEVDTKELDQFVGKIAPPDFQIQELIV